MKAQEIKNKIADLEKRSKNPSLPASAKSSLEKMIAILKSDLEKAEQSEKKEEPKTEKSKAEPKPEAKAQPKTTSKPKRDDDDDMDCEELEEREEVAKKNGYDLDELLAKARENKAKATKRAKERANEPKKTPATKNKEAVARTTERVVTNVQNRVKKGDVNVGEIEKLIGEYEVAISKLKKILSSVKSGVKMRMGGEVEGKKKILKPKMVRSIFEEEEYEYRRGGRTTPRTVRTDIKRDKIYQSKPSGKRKSERVSEIEKTDGTSFLRKNANQYYNDTDGIYGNRREIGKRTYYESANNRSDKGTLSGL